VVIGYGCLAGQRFDDRTGEEVRDAEYVVTGVQRPGSMSITTRLPVLSTSAAACRWRASGTPGGSIKIGAVGLMTAAPSPPMDWRPRRPIWMSVGIVRWATPRRESACPNRQVDERRYLRRHTDHLVVDGYVHEELLQ